MTSDEMRAHITAVLLGRLSHPDPDGERRGEALYDFLALSLPDMDEASLKSIAAKVPELPPALYRKWAGLFAERLLETIPQNQLEELCNGGEDNNATLALVYLMFMESERMEKQVAEDLAELGKQAALAARTARPRQPGAPAQQDSAEAQTQAVAMYLKARLRQKDRTQ